MFGNVYKGKKVLITGNTGFKGSWLTVWLLKLGAEVIGVSNNVPTNPSMFETLSLKDSIKQYMLDIRELDTFTEVLDTERPDFVFHLAAQAIVSQSYDDPIYTISTNVMGTANVLEALRKLKFSCTAVIITSDKCYDNVEQIWGYKENDHMGGKDIYSGSKGAAELIINSYYHSFFKDNKNIKLGIARAGNVIGGGDWAKDRIVVDCMEAWSKADVVEIRSPDSTRPWQHVLEPLSGYLVLGAELYKSPELDGEGFNFGPRAEHNHSVLELLEDLADLWGFKEKNQAYRVIDNIPFHEAGLLKLNCDKALSFLKWQAVLEYKKTIKMVGEWYYEYYINENKDMLEYTTKQISSYENEAASRGLAWMV